MTVLKFPEAEDKIWVCNCGCTTMHLHADGQTECPSCGSYEPHGEWRLGEEVIKDHDAVQTVRIISTSSNFIFRRFAQQVMKEDVVAAALFREDGSQRTVYSDEAMPENDADRRWWRRRARTMLKDLDSDWKRRATIKKSTR